MTSIQKRDGKAEVSIEYFPASGLVAERALMTGAHALRRFEPDFQTVTFGAGGTATDGSFEWSTRLAKLTDIPTASHLTLSHFEDAACVFAFTDRLWDAGIRHLVLLRGDPAPGRKGLAGFESVAAALRALRHRKSWEISVSAYPETHPLAQGRVADLDVLRAKQNAGAARAITQFFFDNSDFYRFRDEAGKAGVHLPLVPGIMPIGNFDKIASFAENCGASVPDWLRKRFAEAGDDKAKRSDVARDVVETQVRDLAANGVDAIHVYSMNRVDLTADAIRAFQNCFTGQSLPTNLRLVG